VIHAYAAEDSRIGNEGYLLDVTPSGIELAANTTAGMFYAFQTLGQLMKNAEGGALPAMSIVDSPFKPLRGAHFYVPSRQNLLWFRRFLDFLARYKYNTIFLEIGASMQFDSHPEINEKWESFCKEMRVYPGGPDSNYWGDNGMQMLTGNIKNSVHIENGGGSCITKAEMSQIAEWCRERHIEIIPEVQGLAHAYWMLLAHPECAERSDDPYPDTSCPSNPRTYEIYFDCMQEIVDVLRPRMVSLGHDEYAWIGFCDRCKGKTGHDIFAEDILKCHGWLKERGIRTHVWADKFYNLVKKDEVEIGMGSGGGKHLNYNLRTNSNELVKPTYRSLDCMPEDILLGDWYYSVGPCTQDMFGDRGLKVVFGNFAARSFEDVEARMRRPNVVGAEVSLWHETSDLGMSMADNYTKYLDTINILWHKGYDFRQCGDYNSVISHLLLFVSRIYVFDSLGISAIRAYVLFICFLGVCTLLDGIHHLAKMYELVANHFIFLIKSNAEDVPFSHFQISHTFSPGTEHSSDL
jgi:hexosaminidase